MLNIAKRYTFIVGIWGTYPRGTYHRIALQWEKQRQCRYLDFRTAVLKAARAIDLPYFPSRLPLGLLIRVRAQHHVDPMRVRRTVVEALRYRCWIRPKMVALYIRVRKVRWAEEEQTRVTISRMDL